MFLENNKPKGKSITTLNKAIIAKNKLIKVFISVCFNLLLLALFFCMQIYYIYSMYANKIQIIFQKKYLTLFTPYYIILSASGCLLFPDLTQSTRLTDHRGLTDEQTRNGDGQAKKESQTDHTQTDGHHQQHPERRQLQAAPPRAYLHPIRTGGRDASGRSEARGFHRGRG